MFVYIQAQLIAVGIWWEYFFSYNTGLTLYQFNQATEYKVLLKIIHWQSTGLNKLPSVFSDSYSFNKYSLKKGDSKEILTAMRVMVVSIGSRGSHIPAMIPRRLRRGVIAGMWDPRDPIETTMTRIFKQSIFLLYTEQYVCYTPK